MTDSPSTRREFLKPDAGPADVTDGDVPSAGGTIRVATHAMACEFSVVMNPGAHERVSVVGDVLEMIHDIEGWLSIYRSNSEIAKVNREAAAGPVRVQPALFELLQTAVHLFEQTDGAFDIAAGAQVQLWKKCRSEQRVPAEEEIAAVLGHSTSQNVRLASKDSAVRFLHETVQLDPGAIGKGYALDEATDWLRKMDDGPKEFLVHGGQSSLVGRGGHNGHDGWPVGIGNPLFTKKRLGTVLLKDQAMSTSGSNTQFFHHDGRRYGHILDPRTATPVDGMLSVTVFAESAAIADALSTAFFVLGVENARKCCDNFPNVGAILIPFPEKGAKVIPTVIRVPSDQIFWDKDQVGGDC